MKYYLVPENELLSLFENSYKLVALESGGVDNWSWHGDSIRNFLDTYIRANHIDFKDEEDEWDFGFSDVAEREIKRYENN